MTKHTPGPWQLELPLECEMDQRPLLLSGKQLVAEVLGPLTDEDGLHRGHYDCCLIAAAPDLLAVAEAALLHIQPEVEDEVSEGREGRATRLHDALLEAIAKAKGE